MFVYFSLSKLSKGKIIVFLKQRLDINENAKSVISFEKHCLNEIELAISKPEDRQFDTSCQTAKVNNLVKSLSILDFAICLIDNVFKEIGGCLR